MKGTASNMAPATFVAALVAGLIAGLIATGAPVVGSAHASGQDIAAGTGPSPTLPEPDTRLLPIIDVAKGKGWPAGRAPVPADGLAVNAFAVDLYHPRWVYTLPNGDVLVAETNKPADAKGLSGVTGWVARRMMKKAGAAVPSADRIMLLRDSNGDGVADYRSIFLDRLYSPFGMALVGDTLYIANTDAVMAFPYTTGATKIDDAGRRLADLPAGERNHHWTKSLLASADGTKLYVGVGSNSNIAEFGMDEEVDRATILEVDIATGDRRVYASGLRNPVGLAWSDADELWVVVNERDRLGNDLPPDYMTSVTDGAFYGWPYSYFGKHVDERVKPQRPELVSSAVAPDYALGPHVAPLGLAFVADGMLPDAFLGGMFVGLHGSWNREPKSGYKVIFVGFENGEPVGMPRDVLTGFLSDKGDVAYGRPVGVAQAADGSLLVADDVGNTIWRVRKQSEFQGI